jgi:murein DD-endopeptidase MepM/ murein hydrolase activator NlpD
MRAIEAWRKAARIVLALVVMMGGLILLPGPTSRVLSPDAIAQIVPTPTVPPLPTPLPQPSQSDDDDDDDDDPGGGGSGGGQGGSGGSGGSEPSNQESDGKQSKGDKKGAKKNKRGGRPGGGKFVGGPVPSGAFSTDRLMGAAARLGSLGASRRQIITKVFPPFIIAGEASWTNTWGAPRFGPGPIVRTHEGQDVFCRYGDPVLAPEPGVMSYSDSGLGGITARVHTSGSSYWYLTHLSATNAKEHPQGSVVEVGDLIGFCGNSGNAKSTPPHVHFGHYVNGKARNPMRPLVSWLREAERNVGISVAKQSELVVANHDRFTVERRFGDVFTSDVSTFDIPYEFLVAARENADSGPLNLAEATLEALLAQVDEQEAAASASPSTKKATRRLEKSLSGISPDEHDHELAD